MDTGCRFLKSYAECSLYSVTKSVSRLCGSSREEQHERTEIEKPKTLMLIEIHGSSISSEQQNAGQD